MILEREAELAKLQQLLDEAPSEGGRAVLIRGEAGIGKSTLISRFLGDSEGHAHTLLGACDDLLTRQPFGPIWDISRTEPSLAPPLADGDRRAVRDKLLELLSQTSRPTVLVLEDTQWAGEATLDVIKFVGRRVHHANGLLVLTYRDVEVDSEHPLRQVIGDIPPQNLVRMPLERLSAEAVAAMIGTDSFDLEAVLDLTGGNPLFVTEVLAGGTDEVPISVRDSVLTRASKISGPARAVLDLVSVVPGAIERSVADEIVQPTEEQLAECTRQGLLNVTEDELSFPHDLQRRAIESSLTVSMARKLNQQVLDALRESGDRARLVHHAAEAGDIEAIVQFAPQAARAAMTIESTTEAVAHFRTLEPYLDRVATEEQAAILADWAQQEEYLNNPSSVDLFDRAIELNRSVGDERNLARTLTAATRVNRTYGRHTQALAYPTEAIELLEQFGPSLDLVRALSSRALCEFVYTDTNEAVLPFVNRAISVAESLGDEAAMIEPLSIKGQNAFSRGDMGAMALMEECLRLARKSHDRFGEVRTLDNMAAMYGDVREVVRAADLALKARDVAARYEIPKGEAEALATYAEFQLWLGDWALAENSATESLGSNPATESLAWRVLGSIQSRRGRNESRAAIDRLWSLVSPEDGPTMVDPAAGTVAEYIWLSDDRDPELVQRLEEILAEGVALGTPWPSGAFAFWMWKLGLLDHVPDGTADFYGWIINGEYKKSAEFWRDRGIPYEEGLALMHGDESEQIEAVHIFDDLGATATANKVRESLVKAGRRVPRGKSRATRENVAGLTARQAEVLELLARGMTNTDIANNLFVSQRTVENHVSAILMKLDAPSRDAAVEAARELGIL